MAWTLLLGVIAFTLLYCWLLAHRFKLAWLEDRFADRQMELAIDERRAEAVGEVDAAKAAADRPEPEVLTS
jgi:heme exporter protein C